MKTQKQRIFSFLTILAIAVIMTCIFAACDKTDSQNPDFKVTIHPNNGQTDIVWDIKTDIPVITQYGYHIVGYYLDADMTISTSLESLKTSELTKNIDVYVKWEKDSVPPKTKIVTNNLLCDYDTRTLSGKVSNSTTVFSFNDEISVEKGATYTISTDLNGINVIPSKTVNLEIGDNVFYILVSNEDELTLYTATVRRKPIYTVAFDTLGGTEVEPQQVEEDAFAAAPTTEKNGCTFEKWDWDFATPITENTTVTAIWNAFVYNIVYDLNIPEDSVSQEVDNSMNPTTYTVDDTIYFSAPRRNGYYFTGWSISRIVKGTTGTITTTAQWSPITYEIIYDFNDENSVSKAKNNDLNPRFYCVENEITFAEPTRTGYSFVSWDKNIEKGMTGTQTVTASWDVNQYNIEYVLNGWTNAENNKTTYTIEDQTFALFDGISGERLFCGWYFDDEYTNYVETIDASTMKDYTVYAIPDCGATKGLTIENGVVKGYSGTSNEVVIPSFYKGYAVDSLVESSFKDCAILTSVTVPNSVTKIETGSFFGCSALESISIPFVGASNTARKGYDQVLGYIFGYKEIASSFSIIIDGDVTVQYVESSNKQYVHYGYYIPESLKNVVISGEMTIIPDNAFKNCDMLTSITIPDSVTVIRYKAFQHCRMLRCFTIPDNVATICGDAFNGCVGLTNVAFGDGVTGIGENAFYGCNNLQYIYIADISTWCNISGLDNLMRYGANNKNLYLNNELVSSVSIPNEVTAITSHAFYGCESIVSVTISDSVTSVGSSAFSGCTGLTKITGPSDVVSTVAKQCNSKAVDGIVITSGTSIGDSAFLYCSGLTSVTLPNSVTSIGNSAFSHCSGLTSITIPNSVTSIGDHAFYECSGLTSVSLGNGVRSIGDSAFNGCEKLTSITIPHGVESIGNYAFLACWRLIEVHNKSSLTIIAGSSDNGHVASRSKNVYTDTEGESKLSTDTDYVLYTNGTEKIVVAYTGTETKLTLPSYITQINDWAFYNCAELTSITIPDSVRSIGYSAFSGCTGLTSIMIGKNVTNIGSSAFLDCTGLTRIIVDNENTKYHSAGNCLIETATKTLILGCKTSVIPSDGTVTSIGNSAFCYCSDLTSITIPDSVTNIDYGAFRNCSGLTNINFEGTKEQWNAITKGDNWNDGVATDCTITCSDGTI